MKKKKTQAITNHNKRTELILLSLILLLTVFVFSVSLKNGFVNLDDGEYVVNNHLLNDLSFSGIQQIFSSYVAGNYHPLTVLTDAILFRLFGLNPLAFHLFSLLLHLLNIILVFYLTTQLIKNPKSAALVSVLFAIHPLHVETVCWISDLKDLQYTFFFLASLLCYVRYLQTGRWKFLAGCGLLFIGSLLSKPSAVILPVVLLLFDYYFGRKPGLKSLAEKVPFFALSLGAGIVNIYAQRTIDTFNIPVSLNWIERICLPCYTLLYYLYSLFGNYHLSVIHPYPDKTNGSLPFIYYLSPPFLFILMSCFTWFIVKKKEYERDLIFGALFFLLTILLMLQITPIGHSVVSERYTYLPYFGLFFIAAILYNRMNNSSRRTQVHLFILLVVCVFSLTSMQRSKIWVDTMSLSTDIIEKYPEYNLPYCLRAGEKTRLNDPQGALQDYNKALALVPDFAEVYYNRALTKKSLNDIPGALEDFGTCIRLKPSFADAYGARADIRRMQGDLVGAISDYDQSLQVKPGIAETFNNRGEAKRFAGDYEGALADYNEALRLSPRMLAALNNRGIARYFLNDLNGSVADFTTSLGIQQDATPYNNRGNVKMKMNDSEGALSDYSMAISLNPRYADAYFSRALIRLNRNDMTGGCSDLKQAADLGKPDALTYLQTYCR